MRFLPRLLGWSRRFVSAGALVVAAAADASEKIAQALRDSLPRYDPSQHAAAEQAKATATSAPSPVLKPGVEAAGESPMPAKNIGTDPAVVQLEPFTVRGQRTKPTVKLPRLHVPEALRPSQDTSDPYLTPAERSRRLNKKYNNGLTQVLNYFGGGGLGSGEEARATYGAELNELADKIGLAATVGASEEELKQLRELYLQLYMARPKDR